jgi:hypothetical protein
MAEKRHKFVHTDAEFHDDGSLTVHHVHEEGPHKDVRHAVSDLDGLHDSIQEHLNPEEIEEKVEKMGQDPEQLEENVSPGIHEKVLKMAVEKSS